MREVSSSLFRSPALLALISSSLGIQVQEAGQCRKELHHRQSSPLPHNPPQTIHSLRPQDWRDDRLPRDAQTRSLHVRCGCYPVFEKPSRARAHRSLLNEQRSSDPTYKLYGVINHSGGGPHSGHYTANVKASNQKWYSMNDSSVSPCAPPINNRSAYVLFYIREKGESLKTAINSGVISNGDGVKGVNGHGKRPRERDDAGSPHVKTNGSPAGSIASSNGVANGGGGKGWAQNGNGSPSPKKQKKHLNGGGPRPPIVETAALSAQASNGHFANAYATPPLSPGATASSNVKGVFQSNANGAGTSKKQQTLAQKQKLQLSAVGVLKKEAKPKGPKMTQKLQPKTIREP